MVYGETFLRNFKFYAKTLTKLHDLTVRYLQKEGGPGTSTAPADLPKPVPYRQFSGSFDSRIRMRIRLRQWPSSCQQNIIFPPKLFCFFLFEWFTSFFKGIRSKRSHKIAESKVFLSFFLVVDGRIRIRTLTNKFRIRRRPKNIRILRITIQMPIRHTAYRYR